MSIRDMLYMKYRAEADRLCQYLPEAKRIEWALCKADLALKGKDPAPISSGVPFNPDHYRFRRSA
jgi:hypothetical protein